MKFLLRIFLSLLCFLLIFSYSNRLMGQGNDKDNLLPPSAIKTDAVANTISWQKPGLLILKGYFENETFPPSGWTSSSWGKGWMRSGLEPFQIWTVPDNGSHYALVNDDSAAVQNDGSEDMLISPVLDLTATDSFLLTYSSYFNAAYGQAATVVYKTDPFSPWNDLDRPEAGFNWNNDTVDLSAFSGPEGANYFRLAFHADDRGNHASGWAVDDVEVFGRVNSISPSDYLLFWDGEKLDSTQNLSFALPFALYGENHQVGICARYAEGNSDTVTLDYNSKYLPPPEDLGLDFIIDNYIILSWRTPYHVPYCNPLDLQSVFETGSTEAEGGCETDWEYVYISFQNSNRIDKYDFSGNRVEVFFIPGIPGLYDLAYDPNSGLMYGGHGGNTVYIMDFNEKTKIGEFTAPVQVHGLAYDLWEDFFWANNLSSDITAFDTEGNIYASFPVGMYGNITGLASDWWNYGDLWGFSRDGSGSVLVQYDLDNGGQIGQTLDVSYLSENGGLACGLYTTYDFDGHCALLGGSLQNDLVFEYSLHEILYYGWNPPGLLYYILYNQDTVIYTDNFTTYYYYQPAFQTTNYKFEVSAWYDLEAFGYPGEFAESGRSGPLYLNFGGTQADLTLNFEETWISGNFTENQWDTSGQGWSIQSNMGNPYPAAAFRGFSYPGSYDATLTSGWLHAPRGDSCDVMLYLDMKIMDYFPTGLQTLTVEALNRIENTWEEVKEYRNDTVMLYFTTDSVLLNPYISSNLLKIRFHVFGDDGADVAYWIIDNIRVVYTCLPPYSLLAEMDPEQDSVLVSWQFPYDRCENWIHYDDSIHFTNAGFDEGPENWFDVATRWEADSVWKYDGYNITGLAIYPTMSEASYVMKIWSGDSAQNLVYEKIAGEIVPGEWNFTELDPPVPVDHFRDLWIGYSCSSRGGYPFSMDAGPAADGYSNLVRIDSEWTTMLAVNPDMDYNFNIQAQLTRPRGHVEAFQVYRSIAGGPYQHIATTDSNHIMLPLAGTTEEQCFKSRIVCWNQPEMIIVSGFSDVDCVLPVTVEENITDGQNMSVYPNPVKGDLKIETKVAVKSLKLYDMEGREVISISPAQNSMDLNINLENIDPGIYLLKIETEAEIQNFKVIKVGE